MPSRPARKKLSQEVTDSILKMIKSGEFSLGEQIPPESKLADMFQVSRTAVREGVKSLIAIGVIETRQGVGTFVRDSQPGPLRITGTAGQPTLALLLDLLEFRRILEPETAALAAQRRTALDLQRLELCVLELEKGVMRSERPPEDLGFHLALARATGNSALIDTSSMIIRFYEGDEFRPDELDIHEHRAIYEAVRDGDAESARQAMRSHLDRMLELRIRVGDISICPE